MLVLVGVSPELWHAGSGSSAVQRRGVHEHHESGCYLIVLNVVNMLCLHLKNIHAGLFDESFCSATRLLRAASQWTLCSTDEIQRYARYHTVEAAASAVLSWQVFGTIPGTVSSS